MSSSGSGWKEEKGRVTGKTYAKDLKVCFGGCCCILSDYLKMPDAGGCYCSNVCCCCSNEFISCKPSIAPGDIVKSEYMIICDGRRSCVQVCVQTLCMQFK